MTGPPNILVVEDDLGSRITLTTLLETEGYHVNACETAKDSLNHLINQPTDIVVSDLNLPDGSGLQILWALKKINPEPAFIMVTGHASLETAIAAVNQGAFAYHVKPLDIDCFKASMRNALRQINLENDKKHLLEQVQLVNDELNQTVHALEKKNEALQHALAKVKHLSGMLPICVACKKIRNDAGYWNIIENYISQHSEAEFSHGICPGCIEVLCPDLHLQLIKGEARQAQEGSESPLSEQA